MSYAASLGMMAFINGVSDLIICTELASHSRHGYFSPLNGWYQNFVNGTLLLAPMVELMVAYVAYLLYMDFMRNVEPTYEAALFAHYGAVSSLGESAGSRGMCQPAVVPFSGVARKLDEETAAARPPVPFVAKPTAARPPSEQEMQQPEPIPVVRHEDCTSRLMNSAALMASVKGRMKEVENFHKHGLGHLRTIAGTGSREGVKERTDAVHSQQFGDFCLKFANDFPKSETQRIVVALSEASQLDAGEFLYCDLDCSVEGKAQNVSMWLGKGDGKITIQSVCREVPVPTDMAEHTFVLAGMCRYKCCQTLVGKLQDLEV